ncbi:hypothetical protein V8E54_001542 [Elaphomyces granulatus]
MERRPEDRAVEEGVKEVLALSQAHRPKNTRRCYLPKQKEWKASLFPSTLLLVGVREWPFALVGSYDWVDEGKLLLFVKTQVAERAPRKGSRLAAEKKREAKEGAKGSKRNKNKNKKGGPRDEAGMMAEAEASGGHGEVEEAAADTDSSEEEPGSELRLMYNSVRSYVSTIMELWKHQVAKKLHSSPPPHNVAVKALETLVARGEHQRRRNELEDRGLATIKDGYTAKQIPDMTRAVWRNALGPRTSEQSFRTNLLLGHAMLLRQWNRLAIELPDLFSMDRGKGKGAKPGASSSFWITAGVRRSAAPSGSPVVSDRGSRHIPVLAVASLWRGLSLLPGKPGLVVKLLKRHNAHLQEQLNSDTAADWSKRLYSVAGLRMSKVSHAPRASGAQIAELNGVAEGQIRRAGCWNNDQMTGCYLTNLPFEFMRGQADFEPAFSSSYFLARDSGHTWIVGGRLPEATERVESNLAAGAFLELFYPQDAALLRREFPQHDLFNDPIFTTSEYAEFEAAVTAAVRAARGEDPHLVARFAIACAPSPAWSRLAWRATTRCAAPLLSHLGAAESRSHSPPLPAAAGPMPAPTAIESFEEQPPTHRLSRGTTTITDLWEEWTVGLGGQPSVEEVRAGGMVPSSSSILGARWLSQRSSGLWQGEGKVGRW